MLIKTVFNDFVRLNRGFDLPDSEIVSGEYPVVASTNIKAYHHKYKVEPPVVVTGRSGSLGKVQYITEKCWPLNTALYSKDLRNNNAHYIYYYLQTMHLEQYNAGAGVPTLNQNHLHRLKIWVHPKDEQDRVVAFLSTFDKLIKINSDRIKALEKMAENLYKEWFVRFRFPGHETVEFENGIPKGWSIKKLSDISSFTYGKMPDSGKYVEEGYPIFSGYRITGYYDSFMYEKPMLVLIARGVGGTGEVRVSPSFSYITNLAIVFLLFQPELHLNYLYRLFSIQNLRYLDTGAAQSQITIDNLKNVRVVLPPDELLIDYNKKAEMIKRQIDTILKTNDNLIKQRDLLLPRLMSDKLEV